MENREPREPVTTSIEAEKDTLWTQRAASGLGLAAIVALAMGGSTQATVEADEGMSVAEYTAHYFNQESGFGDSAEGETYSAADYPYSSAATGIPASILDAINEPEEPTPPAEEKPEEPVEPVEPVEPAEPQEPKNQGMEQFKSVELPGGIVERIENEGLPGRIDAQKALYKHAEKETGVPWQIMAAINYREASLRPDLSMLDGSSLGAGTSQDGVKIYPDAKKDAVQAAGILKGNAREYYGVDITDIDNLSETDIANAILAYNRGAMYLNNPGEPMPVSESPYVYNFMNGEQMRWNRADSYNGNDRINRVQGKKDGNLGALVIVTYLMQNP